MINSPTLNGVRLNVYEINAASGGGGEPAQPQAPPRSFSAFNDFIGPINLYLSTNSSGTSASATVNGASDPDNHVYGVAILRKGTTATGRASLYSGEGISMLAGHGKLEAETRMRIITALANATDAYVIRFGFGSSYGSEYTNGVYFEYNYAVSPNWYYCRAVGGTRTKLDTGIPVDLNWHSYRVSISADGATINFYIDTVLVATFSNVTDLNSSHGYTFGVQLNLLSSVGTVDRVVHVDWFKYLWEVTDTANSPTI